MGRAMKGKRAWMALSLVVAALVVVLIARGGCQDGTPQPAASAPAAPTQPPRPPPLEPPAPVLEIPTFTPRASDSKVLVSGKGYEASFSKIDGALRLNGNEVAGGSLELRLATSSISAKSDETTAAVKSADFLEAERHSEVTFASTLITVLEGEGPTHEIKGNLTLHGVLKPLVFPATIRHDGDTISFAATIPLDRRDFGIARAGTPDDPLPTEGTLALELTLVRGEPTRK